MRLWRKCTVSDWLLQCSLITHSWGFMALCWGDAAASVDVTNRGVAIHANCVTVLLHPALWYNLCHREYKSSFSSSSIWGKLALNYSANLNKRIRAYCETYTTKKRKNLHEMLKPANVWRLLLDNWLKVGLISHNDKSTESYHAALKFPSFPLSLTSLKLLRGTFTLVDSGAPCGRKQYEHH